MARPKRTVKRRGRPLRITGVVMTNTVAPPDPVREAEFEAAQAAKQ